MSYKSDYSDLADSPASKVGIRYLVCPPTYLFTLVISRTVCLRVQSDREINENTHGNPTGGHGNKKSDGKAMTGPQRAGHMQD